MSAPCYSNESFTRSEERPIHWIAEASDLQAGYKGPLWGYSVARDKTGAWFKSAATGALTFFAVIEQETHDGDVRSWTLVDREGTLLKVFND